MKTKLKAKLYGKSNAILVEEGNNGRIDGNLLGIISISGSVSAKEVDITKKVKQAIIDHFAVEVEGVNTMKLVVNEVLTNQKELRFSAEWEEDGQELIRDFIIFVTTTY